MFDTTDATYVWEHPGYPQYYVPRHDVRPGLLIPEGRAQHSQFGTVESYALKVGPESRGRAAKVVTDSAIGRLKDTVRFAWDALDGWFEEEEQVFVHARNPYVRVDALRTSRRLRVEAAGVVLAETLSPVAVFETGLRTRYYVERADVRFEHLEPSETVTACPYKGTTSHYWSVDTAGGRIDDVAWSYESPLAEVAAIAGLVAFYDEKVVIHVDGRPTGRNTAGLDGHSVA